LTVTSPPSFRLAMYSRKPSSEPMWVVSTVSTLIDGGVTDSTSASGV
jgi:hypothetical protein